MAEKISIAQPLRAIREYLGLSRSELAEGVCHHTLINFIEHDRRTPSLDLIARLAERLACEPGDLFSAPSPVKLAEIKARRDERTAVASRDAASEAQRQGRDEKAGAA